MEKIIIGLLITLLTIAWFGCRQKPEEPTPPTPIQAPITSPTSEYKEISKSGITLKWKIANANLRVIVRAPTTGWVAVGFKPSRMMQDANIIIGYVKNGQVFIRDDWGTGRTSHQADIELNGTDNITEKSGKEVNSHTELGFTIPLNSGDAKDQPLVPGQSYKVILGYGPDKADDFSTFHKKITGVNPVRKFRNVILKTKNRVIPLTSVFLTGLI